MSPRKPLVTSLDEQEHAAAQELAEDAYTRAAEHGAVAKMLNTLFIDIADRSAEGQRDWADGLWEGMAIVAKYLERDSGELSDALDRINQQLKAAAAPTHGGSNRPK